MSLILRHAVISEFSPNPKSRGNEAPVTGTAIYPIWHTPEGWEKMCNLWNSIVSTVPGCIRMTGGWRVEPVEGHTGYFV